MKQEYRYMMEQIRLTDEEKERIMKNIEHKTTTQSRRPGRKLVVLAVAAALIIAAMGAGLMTWRQIPTNFIRTDEELEEVGIAYDDVFSGYAFNMDFMLSTNDWVIEHSKQSYDLSLEIIQGGPDDGWTRMRTSVMDGSVTDCGTVRHDNYQGDSLSKLGELLDVGWDVSWLEEHYEPLPGGHLAIIRTHMDTEIPCFRSLDGLYQGEDGVQFCLSFERCTEGEWVDTWNVYTRNYTEQYMTQDGAAVDIIMGNDKLEQPMFEASLRYKLNPEGYALFRLDGIYMDLDEIHSLLDSLSLSNLTK